MANANKSHTNTSQFFITLDKCEWLNKKHTIFGKVAGATIFNALRMGELETDSNERPLEPPRITSVEVVENPFDDIFPRYVHDCLCSCGTHTQCVLCVFMILVLTLNIYVYHHRDISKTNPEEIKKQQEKAKQEKKQKEFDKKYKKRKLTLLSFGDEEAEDVPQDNTGIKSSHDILNDKKLSRTTEQDVVNQTKENHERRKNTNSSLREDDPKYSENPEDFDAKMRKKIEAKQAATASSQTQEQEREAKIGERYEEFRKMLKREGDEKRKATKVKGKAADEEQAQKLLTPAQQLRKKYLDRKRQHGSREKETLERLNKFKGSLQAIAKDPSIAPKVDSDKVEGYHGQVLEDEGGEDENSLEWMAAQLKSKKHIDDAYRAGEILDDGMMTYDPVRDTDKPPPGPVEFGATEGREDDNRTRKRHRTDRR